MKHLAAIIVWLCLAASALAGQTYYVAPEGTGDGLTEAAPCSMAKAQDLATPGCTFILLPGTYAGGTFYGSDSYVAGAHLPLRFEFREGAKIVGGNNRGHGLTIEGWNGVEIIDAEITDGKVQQNGCGLWLAGCKNVLIQRPKIDNWHHWGIHLPHCHDVTIEDGYCIRSRKEHGIYVANSASNVTIRRMQLLANAGCGVQSNGDGTNDPPYASLAKTGSINGLTIEDCLFAYNGTLGGADWNGDSVVNATYRRNTHIPGRGKGNAVSLFNSWYNPTPTSRVLIEDCKIFAGPAKYNVFIFGIAEGQPANKLPSDVTVRNNVLVHRGNLGAAGLIEQALGGQAERIEFSGNRLSHDLVVGPAGNTTLAGFGVTGTNTILTAAEIDAELAALPQVTDPGPGLAPTPPPTPVEPLPPLPANAPLATAADVALVDTNEQGGMWLREWHAVDMFGSDYAAQAVRGPYDFTGYHSPITGRSYVNTFGCRWTGFIKPDKSGVYEIIVGSNQSHHFEFCGELVSDVQANDHPVVIAKRPVVRLEAGQYYAFNFGLTTSGGYVVPLQHSIKFRRDDAPDEVRTIPQAWMYPVKDRPGVTPPVDPPPPGTPPPTTPPATRTITVTIEELIRLIHGN